MKMKIQRIALSLSLGVAVAFSMPGALMASPPAGADVVDNVYQDVLKNPPGFVVIDVGMVLMAPDDDTGRTDAWLIGGNVVDGGFWQPAVWRSTIVPHPDGVDIAADKKTLVGSRPCTDVVMHVASISPVPMFLGKPFLAYRKPDI